MSRAILEKKPEEAGIVATVSAQELEQAIEQEVLKALSDDDRTKVKASEISKLEQGPKWQELRSFISGVTLLSDSIAVELKASPTDEPCETADMLNTIRTLTLPFSVQRRGGKTKLIASNNQPIFDEGPKQALVNAVAQAWSWRKKLENGTITSITTIAEDENTTITYISRMLRFAYLAPDIIEVILDGKAPEKFSGMMLREPLPLYWADQRKAFGFASAN